MPMCVCVLHQLFDVDNHVNQHEVDYIFNTEGHLFPLSALLRRSASHQHTDIKHSQREDVEMTPAADTETKDVFTVTRLYNLTSNVSFSLSSSANNMNVKNCSLYTLLTATDLKPQKS